MKCPKCEGEMEEGYVLEYYRYGYDTEYWRKDAPQPVIRKVHNAEQVLEEEASQTNKKIQTFRCSDCGYLESYAK